MTGLVASRIASALAVVVSMAFAGGADAETPSLTWRGAERIGVQCVVAADDGRSEPFRSSLCERVRSLAARGAPGPVAVIEPGDPAILQPRTVTLLVHGSLQSAAAVGGRGRILAFTVRPFRVSGDDSILFGAAPRVASVTTAAGGPALDAALEAALSETLPWRASQSNRPRPIPQQQN